MCLRGQLILLLVPYSPVQPFTVWGLNRLTPPACLCQVVRWVTRKEKHYPLKGEGAQ